MQTIICKNYEEMSQAGARIIASQLTLKPDSVLGLATGSTPIGMYSILGELCAKGEIDFSRVSSYNLDEYYPISPDNPQSYKYFMEENLFSKVNIDRARTHIPSGNSADPEKECKAYEAQIKKAGGIDIQVLGIGSDGHIAFNEPGSSLASRTRIKTLTTDTIIANSRFFDNDINKVPKTAVTVGVGTVMDAKEVLILVNGHNKAQALYHAVEGNITQMWTISVLQMHPRGIIVCDDAATAELKVGTVNYFKDIERENLDPASNLK